MNPIQSSSVTFDVRILENNGQELAQLLPGLAAHHNKVSSYAKKDMKLFGMCHASSSESSKIRDVVRDRIVDIHYNMGLSDKYKIIVSYDSTHKLPQALALLMPNRENFKERKCIELASLITAYWNLNCPENAQEPRRVKGAGSSIIELCKKIGREHQAKYLHLEAASAAMSFYEKHGFKRVDPDVSYSCLDEFTVALIRIPMFFDLEE